MPVGTVYLRLLIVPHHRAGTAMATAPVVATGERRRPAVSGGPRSRRPAKKGGASQKGGAGQQGGAGQKSGAGQKGGAGQEKHTQMTQPR